MSQHKSISYTFQWGSMSFLIDTSSILLRNSLTSVNFFLHAYISLSTKIGAKTRASRKITLIINQSPGNWGPVVPLPTASSQAENVIWTIHLINFFHVTNELSNFACLTTFIYLFIFCLEIDYIINDNKKPN